MLALSAVAIPAIPAEAMGTAAMRIEAAALTKRADVNPGPETACSQPIPLRWCGSYGDEDEQFNRDCKADEKSIHLSSKTHPLFLDNNDRTDFAYTLKLNAADQTEMQTWREQADFFGNENDDPDSFETLEFLPPVHLESFDVVKRPFPQGTRLCWGGPKDDEDEDCMACSEETSQCYEASALSQMTLEVDHLADGEGVTSTQTLDVSQTDWPHPNTFDQTPPKFLRVDVGKKNVTALRLKGSKAKNHWAVKNFCAMKLNAVHGDPSACRAPRTANCQLAAREGAGMEGRAARVCHCRWRLTHGAVRCMRQSSGAMVRLKGHISGSDRARLLRCSVGAPTTRRATSLPARHVHSR